jgi:DUF971 family protein
MSSSRTTPEEIRLDRNRTGLAIRFSDGASFNLPSDYLRIFSPSAETGAAIGQDPRLWIRVLPTLRIRSLETVGRYAIRIAFEDGHDSGIYAYDFLRDLGETRAERWARYQHHLESVQIPTREDSR